MINSVSLLLFEAFWTKIKTAKRRNPLKSADERKQNEIKKKHAKVKVSTWSRRTKMPKKASRPIDEGQAKPRQIYAFWPKYVKEKWKLN